MNNRSQGERDAITVEIMYAVVTASVVALLAFGVVAGPVFLLDLGHPARGLLLLGGAAAAVLGFVARTAHVLWRFSYAGDSARRQPSQPGRTRPDS